MNCPCVLLTVAVASVVLHAIFSVLGAFSLFVHLHHCQCLAFRICSVLGLPFLLIAFN